MLEIKVKAKNVIELLRKLGENDEILCTLHLDVGVGKKTTEILNSLSEDWDFLGAAEEGKPDPDFKEKNVEFETKEIQNQDNTEINHLDFYTKTLGIEDYNSMATLVEAVFKVSRNSPGIKFESGLFYNILEIEYDKIANQYLSVEHAILAKIIESYYYKVPNFEEALEDTVQKLRGLWITKQLETYPNTTSLTKILYGNGQS